MKKNTRLVASCYKTKRGESVFEWLESLPYKFRWDYLKKYEWEKLRTARYIVWSETEGLIFY